MARDQEVQPGLGIDDRGKVRFDVGDEPIVEGDEQRIEQFALAAEIGVDRPLDAARARGDLGDRGIVERALEEDVAGCREDLVATDRFSPAGQGCGHRLD